MEEKLKVHTVRTCSSGFLRSEEKNRKSFCVKLGSIESNGSKVDREGVLNNNLARIIISLALLVHSEMRPWGINPVPHNISGKT